MRIQDRFFTAPYECSCLCKICYASHFVIHLMISESLNGQSATL